MNLTTNYEYDCNYDCACHHKICYVQVLLAMGPMVKFKIVLHIYTIITSHDIINNIDTSFPKGVGFFNETIRSF